MTNDLFATLYVGCDVFEHWVTLFSITSRVAVKLHRAVVRPVSCRLCLLNVPLGLVTSHVHSANISTIFHRIITQARPSESAAVALFLQLRQCELSMGEWGGAGATTGQKGWAMERGYIPPSHQGGLSVRRILIVVFKMTHLQAKGYVSPWRQEITWASRRGFKPLTPLPSPANPHPECWSNFSVK